MEKRQFSVDIDAPLEHVWRTMLEDETYREWTGEFHEGSHFDGDWSEGSTIRFLGPDGDGPDGDGGESGLIARVVEYRPHEFVGLEYLGQIMGGVEDTTSDFAVKLAGLREDYAFSHADGVTTVTVELDAIEEFEEMFEDSWPRSLAKLKEIAER